MTDAEYTERELRKALCDDHGPVETIRLKAEGPTGSSRWVTLTVAEYEKVITAATAAVSERSE